MAEAPIRTRLAANWNQVCEQVAEAAQQAGRSRDDVHIVGVTKYVDAATTAMLVEAGCRSLGENRPQQLWDKAESIRSRDPIQWHLIGHLQRNKVRRTLRYHPLIHSIDSLRLLDAIAAAATDETESNSAAPIDVLLEVNVSGEEAKTGFDESELDSVINQLPRPGVNVLGLMAMAGWGTDPGEARRQFARTREIRDRLAKLCGLPLATLSMGMSNDFAAAIAEGATIVRIGSALYEGIDH